MVSDISLISMDFFDLFEYAFAWVFVVFSFLWGVLGLIEEWDDFSSKLINSLLIIGSIVFFFLMNSSNGFEEAIGVIGCGVGALLIGNSISNNLDDDWVRVAAILCLLAFIAMFVLYGLYI